MERNEIIVQLFHQGLSFRAIGRKVELSRTMVQRVLIGVKSVRRTSRSRTCSYPGCNEPHYGIGLCRACFRVYEARKKCTRKNKKLCSDGGCVRIHFGMGYCRPHYEQIYRYGYAKTKPIKVKMGGGELVLLVDVQTIIVPTVTVQVICINWVKERSYIL